MQTVKLTRRSLSVHRRRILGVFVAIFLGVSFLAGTLMVSDTLNAGIDRLLLQAYSGTDVSVRNATAVSKGPAAERGAIALSLLPRVAHVPGVAAAEPVIQGTGQLLDRSGKLLLVRGPRSAGSWIAMPSLNPYHIVSGHAPRPASDGYPQVVIDRQIAREGHFRLGDTTGLLTPQRIEVRIVGIAKFGSSDSYGGGSYTAFTFANAQRYIAKSTTRITSIAVKAVPGVSQDQLRARIQAALPAGVQAVTGEAIARENIANTNQSFLSLFRDFLLTFAGIALVVCVFSIYNTFAIVVAQQARETALLRLVGAARRQVVALVVLEGLALALIASLAGLGGGVMVALLLSSLFKSGLGMPISGLVVTPGAGALAVGVGVLVTLLACLLPALRAARVPPLGAIRAAAAESPHASRLANRLGGALTIVGAATVVAAATLAGSTAAVPLVALGALLVLAGMITLGPTLARPASALLGAPGAALRGVTGRLARGNAMRAPRRTARAATALMLGVGVVTLFTVLTASLQSGLSSSVSRSLAADLVISSGNGPAPGYSPRLTATLSRLPQVARVAGIGSGTVLLDGSSARLSVVQPDRLSHLLRLSVTEGSLVGLHGNELAVSTSTAQKNHWLIGASVRVTYADGTASRFRIGALFQSDTTVGDYLMPAAAWTAHNAQATDSLILIKVQPGIGLTQAGAAIDRATRPYGAPSVETRQSYINAQGGYLTTLLDVAYGMLAFAITIALLGIGNTLSLSIYERTRELGLMRTVGASREQLRALVRWESLIVSLFGTLGGLAIGLFVGWGLALALARSGGEGVAGQVTVPILQVVLIVAVGAVAGLLAAIRPARRAARLDVLQAVAYE